MSDIKKRSDFKTDNSSRKQVLKCFFRFHVPQCLGRNLLGEDPEHLSELPASLSISEIPKNGVSAQKYCLGESHVQYTIRVDVIRQQTPIASLLRPIQLLPSFPSQPPVCLSHFGGEYTDHVTKPVRGKGRLSLSKSSTSTCTIQATQPDSIALKALDEPLTVSVPLKISVQTRPLNNDSERDLLQLRQQLDIALYGGSDCTGRLISTTFVSTVPRQEVPIEIELSKSDNLTRSQALCSKTTTQLARLGNWKHNAKSGSWDIDMAATLTFSNFKSRTPLLPSFTSSMLSHRYKISLKIEVNTLPRMTFELDVPVMIRYKSEVSNQRPTLVSLPSISELAEDSEPVPYALEDSIGPRLTILEIQELLHNHQFQAPHLHEMDLPAYHPREIGMESPPYVR